MRHGLGFREDAGLRLALLTESQQIRSAEVAQQLLHNLPWATLCTIMDKAAEHRDWYARAVVEYGWSRSILVTQIEADAHQRFGKATTNFERTLPSLAFGTGLGFGQRG